MPKDALVLALLTLLWLVLVVVRATGPTDLADNAQHRQAAYVADLFYNGSWLYQRDVDGTFQSKPPLYNWIAGLLAYVTGRLNEPILYAPCALAALALTWMTYAACRRWELDPWAAGLAAMALLTSPLGVKLVWLARTDTLFACLTWAAALLAFGAVERGWNWLWFWVVAALATLTKGPLSVLFVGAGLGAYCLLRRRRPHWRGFIMGLAIFVALTVGWLTAAVASAGPGLAKKLLGDELVQHALFGVERRVPFYRWYKPPLSFLARFLPWSIAALVAAWAAYRRRLDMPAIVWFGLCYALAGVLLLTVSPHHRADHLAPILPGAAVLAAYWLAVRMQAAPPLRRWGIVAVVACLSVAGAFTHYHLIRPHDPAVRRSIELRRIAERWRAGELPAELVPFRATGAFHFYAKFHRPDSDIHSVISALRSGRPTIVVTTNAGLLWDELFRHGDSQFLLELSERIERLPTDAPRVDLYLQRGLVRTARR